MENEKFCLRWNDFESNISVAFRELRDDKDFFDVTLCCDDEQLQAHKVILSACSPFFRNVLRRNPHQHPLLYLKGVKYSDLQSVLNFMYHGEVNVAQEELDSFLSVAEDLKVKGLTQGKTKPSSERLPPPPAPKVARISHPPQPHKRQASTSSSMAHSSNEFDYSSKPVFQANDDVQEVAPPIKNEPGTLVTQEEEHHVYAEEESTEGYDDYNQYEAQGSTDYSPALEDQGTELGNIFAKYIC